MTTITISVINHKGGVGKTTTAANLGGGLSRKGYNVLLLDIDPQANLTMAMLKPDELGEIEENDFLYNSLLKGKPLDKMEIDSGLWLSPGSIRLADAEIDLISQMARETKLKKVLSKENSFDFRIIDCPPSLNILTINALAASDYVLVPMKADYFSLTALNSIDNIYSSVKENFNEKLEILGFFVNAYEENIKLSKAVKKSVAKQFGDVLLNTVVRKNVALSECVTPPNCTHIFNHKPKSNGAEDFELLTNEIINKL